MGKLKTFVFLGCFVPIPGTEDEKKPGLCCAIAIALGTLIYMFLDLSVYKFII